MQKTNAAEHARQGDTVKIKHDQKEIKNDWAAAASTAPVASTH